MTDEQRELVLHLLSVGDWSNAVATYQEETGVDLDSAALAVKQLATRHGIRRWSLHPGWIIAGLVGGLCLLLFSRQVG